MVKRFSSSVLCIVLIFFFSFPVFAASSDHRNSIGQNSISPAFIGFSFYSSPQSVISTDYVLAEDNLIPKHFGPSDPDISLVSYPVLYFIYSYPYSSLGNSSLELDLSVSSLSEIKISSAKLYGAAASSPSLTLSFIDSLSLDFNKFVGGVTYFNFTRSSVNLNSLYDYLVLELVCSSGGPIDRSLSFSESATLSGGSSSDSVSLSPSGSGSVSLTGRVGFRYLPNSYVYNYTSLPSSFGNALLKVVPLSSSSYNGQSAVYFPTASVFSDVFGFASFTGSVDSDAVIRTVSDGSITMPSYSGKLTSTQASRSISGTISSSDYYTTMVTSSAQLLYGNDGGLVDEVFDQGKTLDNISGNLQTIIDDMQSHSDAASQIGGTVSDSSISSTDATLSSGLGAVDDLSGTANISSFNAPAAGYVALLTNTVPVMLQLGDGLLLNVLLVVLVLSTLLFLLRRLSH